MRLVKTEGSDFLGWEPQLVDYRGEDYTILSHRWAENANDEVLFADIEVIDDGGIDPDTQSRRTNFIYNTGFAHRSARNKAGFEKLRGAAWQALSEGYQFIWVDTCCIDKSSSAELSEAINSMWKWYARSKICYAYLSDVPGGPDGTDIGPESHFATSKWWGRGWTLQELIAPLDVVFFTRTWDPIGEKRSLGDIIFAVSGISFDVLTHARRLESVSIAKRMSWASTRKTTREEDLAYCLMGIFSVNMPLLYGEGGERAFLRLQQEIMRDSDDESIFAWVDTSAQPESLRGLLAEHPSFFAKSSEIIYYEDFEDREPYVMSNRGLSITLQLSLAQDGTYAAALHCPVPQSGDGFLAVYLKRLGKDRQHYARVKCARLGALEKRGALDTIYVRQSFPTHELETVLPYHFFSLRRLNTGQAAHESYRLLQASKYGQLYDSSTTHVNITNSHARAWVPSNVSVNFSVVRGAGKISSVLLFAQGTEDNGRRLIIMLGSISATQIGFDAHAMDEIESLAKMEKMFKPRPAGADAWIELEHHHVKVEIEPRVDGGNQLFITDVTISSMARFTPLQILGSAVADRLEPALGSLPRPQPSTTSNTGGRKIWQRLGRNR